MKGKMMDNGCEFTPIIFAERSEGVLWWDNRWVSIEEFKKQLFKEGDEKSPP